MDGSVRSNKFEKILIISLLLVGFTSKSNLANEEKVEGLQTIFHIYSDGEYIGVLSDEKKLEQLKEDKLNEAASEFEKLLANDRD